MNFLPIVIRPWCQRIPSVRGAVRGARGFESILPSVEMTFPTRFPFYIQVKMSRAPRFVPEGGALVEVTVRTVQSRLLLRPG